MQKIVELRASIAKEAMVTVTGGFELGLISFQLISHLCYCKLDLPFLLRLTYFLFLINLSLIIDKTQTTDKQTDKEGLYLLISRVELLTSLKLWNSLTTVLNVDKYVDYCWNVDRILFETEIGFVYRSCVLGRFGLESKSIKYREF